MPYHLVASGNQMAPRIACTRPSIKRGVQWDGAHLQSYQQRQNGLRRQRMHANFPRLLVRFLPQGK